MACIGDSPEDGRPAAALMRIAAGSGTTLAPAPAMIRHGPAAFAGRPSEPIGPPRWLILPPKGEDQVAIDTRSKRSII
jgi:hypothetical protein